MFTRDDDTAWDRPEGCGPKLPGSGAEVKPLRQMVFEHVRASGHAARADIARALKISAGSVTAITSDLIAAQLLREVGDQPRESGRGRPPVALEVVAEGRYVIGLKLSDEKHSAVLTDFGGCRLADATLETQSERKSTDQILDEVGQLIDLLLAAAKLTAADIMAAGIGVPGLVDSDSGLVAWSPLLVSRNVEFKRAFEARFGLTAIIDNDANMLTLAELWFGAGRARSDFVVVTIEQGVGMGLVLNNRLFRGARGMGLELGHMKVQLDGALCRCGRRGCLEAYLADYALTREASTALGPSAVHGSSTPGVLDRLFDEAKRGNTAAQMIFRRAGRFLSLGLSNVVQLFDPELIILSGSRMRYDYLYADEVLAETEAMTLPDGRAPCKVEIHAWGDLIWAQGATALALSAMTDHVLGDAAV
jgi:predicted NBD/HSP70 family sugar kinase